MCVLATRDISAGEEVLVSYNYELATAPRWYKDLWRTHQEKCNGK